VRSITAARGSRPPKAEPLKMGVHRVDDFEFLYLTPDYGTECSLALKNKNMSDPKKSNIQRGNGFLIAGILSAIGASICCIGPLALLALGVSGAWIGSLTALAPYRPIFIALTLLFLGSAFYRLYLERPVCSPGSACANPRTLKRQRLGFWIVAIVWRGPACMEEVGKPVFERHEVQYAERRHDKQTAESFRIEGSWLRGAEVDHLSLEEAREIAETSVASATKDGLVSVEEAAQIKSDIEAYFRKELVKFRTREELLQDTRSKFPGAVLNIYEKRVGTERTAAVRERGIQNPFDHADQEETSSCCP
jgi:mercuric ion transport protein